MVRTCAIKTCRYKQRPGKEIRSLFKVPKNSLKQWADAVKKTGSVLSENSVICESHFHPNDKIPKFEFDYRKGNSEICTLVGKNRLKPNVVPTIFADHKENHDSAENQLMTIEIPAENAHNDPAENPLASMGSPADDAMEISGLEMQNENQEVLLEDSTIEAYSTQIQNNVGHDESVFSSIFLSKQLPCLPNDSWVMAKGPSMEDPICFEQVQYPVQECIQHKKQVLFYNDGKIDVFLHNKRQSDIYLTAPQSINDLEQILMTVHNLILCQGGPSTKTYKNVQPRFAYEDRDKKWRHNRCPIKIDGGSICKPCSSIDSLLNKHMERRRKNIRPQILLTPLQKKNVDILRDAKRKQTQRIKRQRVQITNLKDEVEKLKIQVKEVTENQLENLLTPMNLPENQVLLIKECVAASKRTGVRGNRYTGEWLMLCLLLNIRSPAAYNFLIENKILPLPSYGTIRRYLRMIDVKCGFDKEFFALLKKKFVHLSAREKHGVLLFDEMKVRTSLDVDTKTLSFSGLPDIGDKTFTTDDLADHALVFMFSSIGGKFHQPIATFASKNATIGTILARLIIQAIIEVERAGGYVDGIICDGASTNRKMWTELGVSGALDNTRHFFMNPTREESKVYVFSDTPHLLKTIRNRFLEVDRVKIKGKYVEWKFYSLLYNEDASNKNNLRVCPKLTVNHINPPKPLRMRVFLATQIFSNSVADGLEFYKKQNPSKFVGCEETIAFTRKMNNLFDALNRSFPAEGIKRGSKDFDVLENSLTWLNEWEREKIKKTIEPNEFLTDQTARGLRVTIMSTLSLCSELLENHNFRYVLTGKMNQDRLEQFFGIIRQAGYQNDHPTLPTFMQLYKMLSIYKIIRPPKYGNCTVRENHDTPPSITMNELKSIFSKKRTDTSARLATLCSKLDGIIETSDWEADDVIDHDYSKALVVDCILYYVTGFVSRKLRKMTNCETCLQVFRGRDSNFGNEADLVNLKTRGGLIHPNHRLYLLFAEVEKHFTKHIETKDSKIYEKTVEDLLRAYKFDFPCEQHKTEVLAYCIDYYVLLRIRQYVRIFNSDLKKVSRLKKKTAKLYDH